MKRQKMARIVTPWYRFVIYCYQSVFEITTPLTRLRIIAILVNNAFKRIAIIRTDEKVSAGGIL